MQFETLTKKQLQFIRLLYKRTERYRNGLFVIEGARAVKQALLNDVLTVYALVGTKRAMDLIEKDSEFFSLVNTRKAENEAKFAKAGEEDAKSAKAGEDGVKTAKTGEDGVKTAKTGEDEVKFAKAGEEDAKSAKAGEEDAKSAKAGEDGVKSAKAGEDGVKSAKTGEDEAKSVSLESANGFLPMEVMSLYMVSSASFRLISDTEATQEILLVCRLPEPALELDLLSGSGLLLVSDRIQDPGNMGSLIRTAVWFGVRGLVVSPDNVDLFHPKLVRSNVGSTAVLPWVKSELPVFLDTASQKGWSVLLLDSGDGSESYKNVKPTGKDIIVVGNEANGISNEIRDMRFPKLRIDSGLPVAHVESLNVSAAAAIMLSRFS